MQESNTAMQAASNVVSLEPAVVQDSVESSNSDTISGSQKDLNFKRGTKAVCMCKSCCVLVAK